MKTIITSLIISLALTLPAKSVVANNNNYNNSTLTEQVKSWIDTSAYWSDPDGQQAAPSQSDSTTTGNVSDQESNDLAITQQLEEWISQGAYWVEEKVDPNQEVANLIKQWLGSVSYNGDDSK